MDPQELAEKVVRKMMDDDAFSRWLEIEVAEIAPGRSVLEMTVTETMTNGFGVTHGGVTFSLADSALAFASNSYGRVAVALENNISYVRRVNEGDRLTAEATELSLGRRIAVYEITVTNQEDRKVALFRGTVFRTQDHHFPR
ncbi:MAG: hydroxyphenylacetyl-CoA thioesterase PaaI [Balneolaceae bacterium]|nr:hydroxyphenylacetyl-CoA thioesterase PaaI [Balneolaceae bacterium]